MARTPESRGLALRSTLAGIAFACCMAATAEEPKAPTSNDQEKTMTTSTSGTVCTTVCGLPENDEDLKKLLTPEQYKVMKENGTERPFANEYWDNHEAGIYVDRISGIPLFSSKDKFDSGTGWPSFTKPLTKSVVKEITDSSHGMSRTEVRAAKSDSHLGHVFDDGPAPTRLRYCMNSASLKFVPAKELPNSGLSAYAADFGIKTTAGTGDSEARDVAPAKLEKATFAAGCFWGVEDILRGTDGVKGTMVGYTGGQKANPTYKEVCTGTTGHAEAVEVEYDPAKVSYDQLLDIFWKNHNPTTLNRQGPDVGTQYRSAIFYHTPEQKTEAEASLKKLQEKYGNKKVVTEIVPATTFNKAEEYHQQYLIKNGLSNCHL